MTDDEYILEEFREAGWRPAKRRDELWNPRENIPEGYEYMPPAWAWDATPEHPPITSVPCSTCGQSSEPYCRYEFKRDDDDVLGWSTGIGLFAYECVEHGMFINQAIERKPDRRKMRVSVS